MERVRAGDLQHGTPEEVQERVVPVSVTFTGPRQPLEQIGLRIHGIEDAVASGAIALADLEQLDALPEVIRIVLRPTDLPRLDKSVPEIRAPLVWNAATPYKGAGVIVAVIDTGIDIFHGSFQNADGTSRILAYWDQDPPAAIPGAINGRNPITLSDGTQFTNGVEWNRAELNQVLIVNKNLPKKRFRSVDDNGHGTHVAGTAAGNGQQHEGCTGPGKYIGVAPEADLVIVRAIALKNSANGNTISALRWVLDVAQRTAGSPAVVVNMSYGRHRGAHDGTEDDEQRIDQRLRDGSGTPLPGRVVVIAAGNEGGDAIHLAGTVQAGTQQTFFFFIRDKDTKTDHFTIWYNAAASLDFGVITPNGTASAPLVSPGGANPPAIEGHAISVSSAAAPRTLNNKKEISFTLDPPLNGKVVTGKWTVVLKETAGIDATFDFWISSEKEDGYPTFADLNEPPPLQITRKIFSIGMPATAASAISVAAYKDENGLLTDFSSWGPSPPAGVLPGAVKPSIAGPGYAIFAPRSNEARERHCSECCHGGYYQDMNGTSMATPHVTGVIALMLQRNKTLTFEQIRTHLQRTARIDGIPASELPPVVDVPNNIRANNIWGAGKVDAQAAVNAVPAVAAGGGGGGGGGHPFVRVDLPPPRPSVRDLVRGWQRDFSGRPAFQLCAALVSTHFDEVQRLINGNRRVAAVWRRHGGPLLVRHVIEQDAHTPPRLPARVGSHDVVTLLDRLLTMLARYGSEAVRADAARHRALVLAVPGRELGELDAQVLAGVAS